ncbi:MAG TPA: hypothetical protein VMA83_04100 [Solirubrobacteraceae bacterium]|nr:hypothetical protein [Solirubrobacteraceae bacterium]
MPRRGGLRLLGGALACTAGVAFACAAGGAFAATRPYSATLEQCVGGTSDAARSATLAGEIHSIRRATRMEIRIDVQERVAGARFRTLGGAALGDWRAAAPQVDSYRDVRKVSGLTAPASYRGLVRFRWLNAGGRVIRSAVAFTPVCRERLRTVHRPMSPEPLATLSEP